MVDNASFIAADATALQTGMTRNNYSRYFFALVLIIPDTHGETLASMHKSQLRSMIIFYNLFLKTPILIFVTIFQKT